MLKKNNGFIHNTVILLAAMFITKLIGAVYKIPLANILGGVGMGYYSSAYGLFAPIYALTAAGLPTAIVKMTAQNVAVGRYRNSIKIRRISVMLFTALGICGTGAMFIFARPFSTSVSASPESFLSILAIAPSIMLCCIMAAYRGFYEGLRNMYPTAVSQVIESIVRAVFGLLLSSFAQRAVLNSYEITGEVLGQSAATYEQAIFLSLPLSAAAAIFGVTLGDLTATVYFIIRSRFKSKDFDDEKAEPDNSTDRIRTIAKQIFKEALPISMGAIVVNLSSFIDLITIPNRLNYAIANNPAFFKSEFGNVFTNQIGMESLPNFMFGCYSGIALSLFMIIPALTSMLGKSSLPAITVACKAGNRADLSGSVTNVLYATLIIAIPSCVGLSVFARPILELLYSSRMTEAQMSVAPLAVLSIGGIAMVCSSTAFSVLQAVGRSDLPFKLMLIGVIIKLFGNYILVGIPRINISGAAISTVLCYSVVAILAFKIMIKEINCKLNFLGIIFPPLVSGVLCVLAAKISHIFVFSSAGTSLSTIISMCIAGIFYIILLIPINKLCNND